MSRPTKPAPVIRDEQREDEAAVSALIERAFGRRDEARLVDRLRADEDAVISLLALEVDVLVGHAMLSRMRVPFRALALAPVSVLPQRQRQGIGRALISEGLARARWSGWQAVFVLGDPAYYERFGFRADLAQGFSCPYAGPYLMAVALNDPWPVRGGWLRHAPAFESMGEQNPDGRLGPTSVPSHKFP